MDKVKQVIVMRAKFPDENGTLKKLRTGKYIAQGAHASMAWLSRRVAQSSKVKLSDEEKRWIEDKFTKVCVYVDTEEELLAIYKQAQDAGLTVSLITDAGLTEFNGKPTNTCLAVGPHEASKIDAITGHLPLF